MSTATEESSSCSSSAAVASLLGRGLKAATEAAMVGTEPRWVESRLGPLDMETSDTLMMSLLSPCTIFLEKLDPHLLEGESCAVIFRRESEKQTQ